jgi:hypothetical protein
MKEWLEQKDLQIGKVYNAYYKQDSIYMVLVRNKLLENTPYIHKRDFSEGSNFNGSFQGPIFKEASEIEVLTMMTSIKNGKYTEPIFGQYKLVKNGGEYYTAAEEINKKLQWTEECKDIVKYIKEDTPVYIFGAASHRPKTFKELKELLWQE